MMVAEAEGGDRGVAVEWAQFSLGRWKILEMDGADGCTIVGILDATELHLKIIKMVNQKLVLKILTGL